MLRLVCAFVVPCDAHVHNFTCGSREQTLEFPPNNFPLALLVGHLRFWGQEALPDKNSAVLAGWVCLT